MSLMEKTEFPVFEFPIFWYCQMMSAVSVRALVTRTLSRCAEGYSALRGVPKHNVLYSVLGGPHTPRTVLNTMAMNHHTVMRQWQRIDSAIPKNCAVFSQNSIKTVLFVLSLAPRSQIVTFGLKSFIRLPGSKKRSFVSFQLREVKDRELQSVKNSRG